MRAAQARADAGLSSDADELHPTMRGEQPGLAASQLLDTVKSCTSFVVSEAAFGAMFMDLHETLTQCTPHTRTVHGYVCFVLSFCVYDVCAVRSLEM